MDWKLSLLLMDEILKFMELIYSRKGSNGLILGDNFQYFEIIVAQLKV